MTGFTHGHALVIGVGADLPTTIDDAEGLAQILRDPERCAYPADQVQVLTGPQATRAQVLAALDKLSHATDAQSTVIVYFSGHGYHVSANAGVGYYLMPFGYDKDLLAQTAISGSEFTSRLRAIPAQKLLLLLDCCHAGGVGEISGGTLTKAPLPPEAQQMLAEGRGRVVIASSRENERSYAGHPYSAFTLALIEVLCGTGVAKQDGYTRVADLALHTRQMVPGRTQDKQHPILHFEQADNFALAYYAGGASQPKALPFTNPPQIEPEPGVMDRERLQQQQRVSGAGAVGVMGNLRNSPIIAGSGNTNTSTGDISGVSGQVAVGSQIAQASGGSSAHVESSHSVFDQRGQRVKGNQYNAARDMTVGREGRATPPPRLSDTRLAQVIQRTIEQHGVDDLLFALGSHTSSAPDAATLGTDPATQARNLVTAVRSQHQRSALLEALLDLDEQTLGTPEEQAAWRAWAREMDGK